MSKQILIIEDDNDISSSLRELLELEFENTKVTIASSGEEGYKMIKEIGHPCLVLLDLFMPGMSGADLVKKLQAEDNTVVLNIPIVVMSAAPPDGDMVKSVKPFTRDFLRKPVDLDKFMEVVKRYCACPV